MNSRLVRTRRRGHGRPPLYVCAAPMCSARPGNAMPGIVGATPSAAAVAHPGQRELDIRQGRRAPVANTTRERLSRELVRRLHERIHDEARMCTKTKLEPNGSPLDATPDSLVHEQCRLGKFERPLRPARGEAAVLVVVLHGVATTDGLSGEREHHRPWAALRLLRLLRRASADVPNHYGVNFGSPQATLAYVRGNVQRSQDPEIGHVEAPWTCNGPPAVLLVVLQRGVRAVCVADRCSSAPPGARRRPAARQQRARARRTGRMSTRRMPPSMSSRSRRQSLGS